MNGAQLGWNHGRWRFESVAGMGEQHGTIRGRAFRVRKQVPEKRTTGEQHVPIGESSLANLMLRTDV